MSTLTATQLQQQYIAYFGRPGDPAGIKYWLSSSSGISSAREFADKIYAQDEYKTSTVGGKSTEAQVNSLYQNLFGREADATGLIYWTNQIESGVLTLSNIAYDLIAAASNPVAGNETQGAADALALSNKVAAATAFTADVEASTSAILAYQPETTTPWKTGAAFESGKSYLAGITTTAHSSSGIDAAVSAMISANTTSGSTAASTTAKFTTSQDVLSGGSGNDIFNGVVIAQAGTGTTIAPGDTVDGGSGTDTVNISFSSAHTGAYTLEAVDLEKVEKVLVSNYETSGNETTVSATLFDSSISTVGLSSSSSTGATTFSNLKQQVGAEMRNGAANLTLTYETAVYKGTADTQSLTVQGVTAGTFTANGAETITVDSVLSKSTLTNVSSTELKTLKVTGDQNLKITTALTTKTIDASGSSGGVNITLGTADQTVTGGSGDDVVDGVGVVTKADTISGGAGTDTLKLEVGNSVIDGTATTGEISKVSGFEVIEVESTNDGATLELDNTSGVTTVIADSNTKTVTVALSANSTDTTVTATAVVDGITFTTATIDLHTGGGNQAADQEDLADGLVAKINANANYTATNAANVITIVSNLEEELDAAITTGADSNAVAITGTTSDYQNVSFTKASDQEVDIYRAGNVTFNKKDASSLTDTATFNLKSHSDNKALNQTITDLTFTEIETATITTSGLNSGKTYTLSALSADSKLTTLNISGSNNLTITDHGSDNTKLATIDASTFTGDLKLSDTRASLAQTITTGSGNDTVVFAGNLTEDDVVDLGGNTALTDGTAGKDRVTATGQLGTSVDLEALQLSNVETFELAVGTTAATYIDASKLVNTNTLNFSATDGTIKITNLGADAVIGLGTNIADAANDVELGTSGTTTLDLSLADSSGSSDSITFDVGDKANASTQVTLKSTGIETLNIKASKEGANPETTTVLTGDNAPANIVVTDGNAADTLALGTLNKNTTSVDASAYKGITTLTGATGVATTVSVAAPVANSVTTSTGNDTVTLTGSLGTADAVYALGTGTDVINATLSSAATNTGQWTGVETLNLTIKDSTTAGFNNTAADNDDALQIAKNINILGGNALSVFAMTSTADFDNGSVTQVIDSSTFNGSVQLQFAADAMDSHVTVIGGSSTTDKVTITVDDIEAKPASVTGIETLVVKATNNDTDASVDLSNVSGLTSVEATFVGTAGDQIELKKLQAGTKVKFTGTATSTSDQDNLVLGMADASSAGTTASVEISAFADLTGANADILNLDGAGIEVLSINNKSGATHNGFDLGGITADTGATTAVTLTGKGGELVNLGSNITSVDAASTTDRVEITAANRTSTAMTFTGGNGGDSVAMENKADVIDGGLGTDTLTISANGVLGGFAVDLTSATDQVTQFGGVANGAIQKGFENVTVTVTGVYGADVTGSDGANTITTTANNDNVDGGKGIDTITLNAGVDVANGGAGADIINGGDGNDTLNGGTDGDTLNGDGNNDTLNGEGGDDTLNGGTGNDTLSGGIGADILNGDDGTDTITGGDGNDIITGGVGNDTLTGGAGADKFVYTTAAHSNAVTAAVMDTITDFLSGTDTLDFTLTGTFAGVTADDGGANVAAMDTTAEIQALYNSTNGSAGGGKRFAGGSNASAILATNTDSSVVLIVDVNGNGTFTSADVAIVVTGGTVAAADFV